MGLLIMGPFAGKITGSEAVTITGTTMPLCSVVSRYLCAAIVLIIVIAWLIFFLLAYGPYIRNPLPSLGMTGRVSVDLRFRRLGVRRH